LFLKYQLLICLINNNTKKHWRLVVNYRPVILKRKWFAKEHVLFCINPALKMLGDALHRLGFSPWFNTK
jgi:hypothetical protein